MRDEGAADRAGPSGGSYEGWCTVDDVQIDWHQDVDRVYNMIRGANPQPGPGRRLLVNGLHCSTAANRMIRMVLPALLRLPTHLGLLSPFTAGRYVSAG